MISHCHASGAFHSQPNILYFSQYRNQFRNDCFKQFFRILLCPLLVMSGVFKKMSCVSFLQNCEIWLKLVLLTTMLSYTSITQEKWRNFVSGSSGKNLKNSSLFLPYDRNDFQSEDGSWFHFSSTIFSSTCRVNLLRYNQLISFILTFHVLSMYLIKHHIYYI